MPAVTLPQLTSTTIEGTGVFDSLMKAASAHLEREFNCKRITGNDYSKVYLAAMQQVMQTGVHFLLEKDKQLLLDEQIKKAKKDTELVNQQILNLVCENSKCIEEINILKAELPLIAKKGNLLDQQVAKEAKEISMLDKQINKVQKDIEMLTQQIVVAQKDIEVRTAQISKIDTEKNLLNQKIQTEKAQTESSVIGGNSVIDFQNKLYQAQTNGYDRDAKTKIAKTMIDTWNVRRTTDEGTLADNDNKLRNIDVGAAVQAMFNSAGINLP